jgi:fructose-1,6-bisphosphatase
MTPEERTKIIQQIVVLANENMDHNIKDLISQQEAKAALEKMADNVVEQIINLNDGERLIVAMATITKLLVENFVLLQARSNEQ